MTVHHNFSREVLTGWVIMFSFNIWNKTYVRAHPFPVTSNRSVSQYLKVVILNVIETWVQEVASHSPSFQHLQKESIFLKLSCVRISQVHLGKPEFVISPHGMEGNIFISMPFRFDLKIYLHIWTKSYKAISNCLSQTYLSIFFHMTCPFKARKYVNAHDHL